VSPNEAITLMENMMITTAYLGGPVLAASLLAGLLIGILQTATQINEASLSYVVKVIAVVAVLLAVGPQILEKAMEYTRTSFESIAGVVQ
jgi:flagellar biosynthetic protein FliQ